MNSAFVEADNGERIRIRYHDDGWEGNALLEFVIALDSYCLGVDDKETQSWFSDLNSMTEVPICDMCVPLINAYYTGEWDYAENEYGLFLLRSPNVAISENDFRSAISQVQDKWTKIKDVISGTESLVKLLINANMREGLIMSRNTLPGFKALLDSLRVLESRNAEKVRIKFV